tara:strand:+ start:726 stop:1409 length:684 start_codon:yes stop_codon:yes gene_type:complete
MSLILHIETASKNCSVALAKSGRLLALEEIATAHYSHAEQLHPFIQELFEATDFKVENLDSVAVSKGPGSFTGLRIGVAAAKGICFALDIPLIAINTLELMAQSHINDKNRWLIPMLDARRMEVYTAVFDGAGKEIKPTWAEVLFPNSLGALLENQKAYVFGEGAKKFKTITENENLLFLDNYDFPSARQMVAMAYEAFKTKQFEDLAYFEPFYLKEFISNPPKSKH